MIIPVYNEERYLEECLDSVVGQTYGDLDIIIVDDGSTDRSGDICDRYAESDERVSVIHKENGGLSSARNAGLDAAKGEYLAFIDSDDYIAKDMIENMLDVLKRHDADIVKCNFVRVREGKPSSDCSDDTGAETVYSSKEAVKSFLTEKYSRKKAFAVSACNALYKTETVKDIRFPEGLLYEDGFYSPVAFLAAETLVHVDRTFYYYRASPDSITARGVTEKSLESLDDWEFIYNRIYEKYPETAFLAVPRWIRRFLQIYDNLLKNDEIDRSGKWKRHIVEKIRENRVLFLSAADETQAKKLKLLARDPEKYARYMTEGSFLHRVKASVSGLLRK
ncbi:MAG: glycosyltransferase [Clostridiales bacterium]|nr:glycosyltransferase [Clostridiales bacterium]